MAHIFIAVGSNMGDRRAYLDKAQQLFLGWTGVKNVKASPIYETSPVGGPPQNNYLNLVWSADVNDSAELTLAGLLRIEETLERKRSIKNAPRTIDLDLLFYGQEVIQSACLTVPHPRLHERWFVLKPLFDLAPDFRHPILGKTVKEMLEALPLYERN